MNPYAAALIALTVIGKTFPYDYEVSALMEALAAKIMPLYDEWQRQQTTAIDEEGNIVIGLQTLAMSAGQLSMR